MVESVKNAPTVLIAAPDANTRNTLRTILNANQYNLIEAEDGEQALNQSALCKPMLAVVTPDLAHISGFEICERLRDLPEKDSPLVLMLLETEDAALFTRAFESGALDVIYPPINPVVLRHRIGVLLQMRDIRDALSENQTLLLQQTHELQERNKELDAFAHTVAHDLKNPIASMMGFASLVINYYDRMTDDRVREYLNLIMESGYKLKEIINSILLLAGVNRMETVEIKPIDMNAVIKGARSRLSPMIDQQQAVIILPRKWPKALGYAPWVEEVWANYLSNALKYGGQPPQIQLGADRPIDGKVRFWVKDNGGGLTEEEIQKVFTPFTRLSQAKIEGHGLGLSVVQRIVERLDGEVGVESKVGKGSKFTFTLPSAQ